ncbi:MAG: peptide ABC transporter substrate-binding protein [Candidatus Wolfebacteria bacterium]|nr:peptide ABC transporter substrate-binding protein [Candidatus Wolfebacteria bacterium]
MAFFSSLALFVIAGIYLSANFVRAATVLRPVAGGGYTEGKVGQPVFINPVIAANEVDSDIIELTFASINDLKDGDIGIENNGKVWKLRIKGDINWQDGSPITSDDIIFTIKAIQDQDANSSLFPDWQGVKTERVSSREIKLILSAPYVFFENTLINLRPIPKHIFGDIPFSNIRLSDYNLIAPVGSGPFKFSDLKKRRDGFITDYELVRNETYFNQKPYLNKFTFKFYTSEKDALNAFNGGLISGLGAVSYNNLDKITIPHKIEAINMPRYYGIFFNQSVNPILSDINVRKALDLATDRERIIKDVFKGMAIPLIGPLVPGISGYSENFFKQQNEFSPDRAKNLLEASGWQVSSDGIRQNSEKNARLEFSLTTPEIPFLTDSAKIIQEDWQKIGVKINLDIKPSDEIFPDIIKPRDYEMILFGNIYGKNPDLFSFWHSSQKFHPGLNLSLYENKDVDFLINSIRADFNADARREKMLQAQSLIKNDQPVIFLFSPPYIYIQSKSLNGFEEKILPLPSSRLENIKDWYVKTERVFK